MTRASRVWLLRMAWALFACALPMPGCELGGSESSSETGAAPTGEFKLPTVDFSAVAAERETREAAETQLQRGAQCGWRASWMTALREARQDGPSAFRSQTVGAAFGWAAVCLVIGLGGTLLFAWLLPRLRRRAKRQTDAAGTSGAPQSWGAWARSLVWRFFARAGRTLRVEQFDPTLADERQRMIDMCRDAERQLTVARTVVTTLAPEAPKAAASEAATTPSASAAIEIAVSESATLGAQLESTGDAAPPTQPPQPQTTQPPQPQTTSPAVPLKTAIDIWQAEVTSLRRRLEAPSPLPLELAPDRISPPLAVTLRATRDLRLAAERALIAGLPAESIWPALERELADKPETPRDQSALPLSALPPYVRTVGYAGLGGLCLALVMLACWMGAGAFPLFFALLFGLASLGAIMFARVHLHRAGRLPLLPGFSDRVASWLTGVLALTLLATIISSWMSTESGLDLGDPPPVAMPDPKQLEAPRFFPNTPAAMPAPMAVPTPPAPTPAPTPTTAAPDTTPLFPTLPTLPTPPPTTATPDASE